MFSAVIWARSAVTCGHTGTGDWQLTTSEWTRCSSLLDNWDSTTQGTRLIAAITVKQRFQHTIKVYEPLKFKPETDSRNPVWVGRSDDPTDMFEERFADVMKILFMNVKKFPVFLLIMWTLRTHSIVSFFKHCGNVTFDSSLIVLKQ